MDQGLANVLAAVILFAGGTFLGGYIESRRANSRAKTEREWQAQQQKEQADREDARRRELWAWEDSLAQRARLREALLRDLHATQEQCLATLNLFVLQAEGGVQAVGGVDVGAAHELGGEKYSHADVGLVGDTATVGLYFGTLARLLGHPATTPLDYSLRSACADASAEVRARIREQEARVIRDERVQYITAYRLTDIPPELRNSPMILGMLHPSAGNG
jgi:hypothetical protein